MLSSGFRRARKYPSPDMSDTPCLVKGSPQMTNSEEKNQPSKMYREKYPTWQFGLSQNIHELNQTKLSQICGRTESRKS